MGEMAATFNPATFTYTYTCTRVEREKKTLWPQAVLTTTSSFWLPAKD